MSIITANDYYQIYEVFHEYPTSREVQHTKFLDISPDNRNKYLDFSINALKYEEYSIQIEWGGFYMQSDYIKMKQSAIIILHELCWIAKYLNDGLTIDRILNGLYMACPFTPTENNEISYNKWFVKILCNIQRSYVDIYPQKSNYILSWIIKNKLGVINNNPKIISDIPSGILFIKMIPCHTVIFGHHKLTKIYVPIQNMLHEHPHIYHLPMRVSIDQCYKLQKHLLDILYCPSIAQHMCQTCIYLFEILTDLDINICRTLYNRICCLNKSTRQALTFTSDKLAVRKLKMDVTYGTHSDFSKENIFNSLNTSYYYTSPPDNLVKIYDINNIEVGIYRMDHLLIHSKFIRCMMEYGGKEYNRWEKSRKIKILRKAQVVKYMLDISLYKPITPIFDDILDVMMVCWVYNDNLCMSRCKSILTKCNITLVNIITYMTKYRCLNNDDGVKKCMNDIFMKILPQAHQEFGYKLLDAVYVSISAI